MDSSNSLSNSSRDYVAMHHETDVRAALEQVSDTREYTGGSVNYYKIKVEDPTTPLNRPYMAECNDIIEALGMNYAEGNVLKALWRICANRKGLSKRGYTDGVYDAEKIIFFGNRVLHQQREHQQREHQQRES